jgi:hypothetical protein
MEIKYPFIIVLSIILFILSFIFSFKKIKTRRHKRKVANTSIVKNSLLYKRIIAKYKVGIYITYVLVFICILFSSFLSSRLIETKTIENKIYNRDIILCMDISQSVNSLNSDLVDSYRDVIKSLNGERFGISIFNTTSYLLVPLTDDYEFVNDALSVLKKSFNVNTEATTTEEYFYLLRYITTGTQMNYEERGSSLIGDGLAACAFDFPNLEEDRTRIIIFSTDNDLQGTPYISTVEAGELAQSLGIKVYTMAPKLTDKSFISDLQKVANTTGGKFFQQGKGETVKDIVKSIESEEKTVLEGSKKTVVTDYPEVFLVIVFLGFAGLVIIDKVVLS